MVANNSSCCVVVGTIYPEARGEEWGWGGMGGGGEGVGGSYFPHPHPQSFKQHPPVLDCELCSVAESL